MNIFDCDLPKGWSRSPVSEAYRITKKPRGSKPEADAVIPFVPMEKVPAGGRTECAFELRKKSAIASGTYFEAGDILLSKITPSFENGKQGMAINLPGTYGYGSTELIPLQAQTDQAINLYLFYLLLNHQVRDYLSSKMEGSTGRKRVPEQALMDLRIPVASRPEQEKIAAVLWKMQQAIAIQDRLIAATRDLKASALQRLFTHGLRGEPLKDTEIGPVPTSWDIAPLGTLTVPSDVVNVREEADRTIRYIDVSAVSRETLSVTDTVSYVLREAPGRARKRVLKGDVIFATVRPTLLRVARIGETLNNEVCSTAFCVLRDRDPKLRGGYIFYVVQRREFIEQLARIEKGASYPAVTDRQVKDQLIPIPSPEERQSIAAQLEVVDRKLTHHQKKRAALSDLFQTLLHNLMTADIRVNDLDIDVSEVAA